MSPDLQTALDELASAIQSITLGSVEAVVTQERGHANHCEYDTVVRPAVTAVIVVSVKAISHAIIVIATKA